MSEQAPERPAGQPAGGPPGKPPGKENVFTRKIGPLPMWVWLAIVAVVIVGYFLLSKKKKGGSSSQGQGQGKQQGGFGSALLPEIIVERFGGPPHVRHRHHRGGHHHGDHDHDRRGRHGIDPGGPRRGGPGPDPGGPRHSPEEAVALEADRQKAVRDPGPGTHNLPGHNRRHMRGEPVPGELVTFKTAEDGQTPSLSDVANHYNTAPEAIVMEAEGRGYPSSPTWKRYVAAHDWQSPLPPATELSILAHPG